MVAFFHGLVVARSMLCSWFRSSMAYFRGMPCSWLLSSMAYFKAWLEPQGCFAHGCFLPWPTLKAWLEPLLSSRCLAHGCFLPCGATWLLSSMMVAFKVESWVLSMAEDVEAKATQQNMCVAHCTQTMCVDESACAMCKQDMCR